MYGKRNLENAPYANQICCFFGCLFRKAVIFLDEANYLNCSALYVFVCNLIYFKLSVSF